MERRHSDREHISDEPPLFSSSKQPRMSFTLQNITFAAPRPRFVSRIPVSTTLIPQIKLRRNLPFNSYVVIQRRSRSKNRILGLEICCSISEGGSGSAKWLNWLPNVAGADKVLRLIGGATSSPISQYISTPATFLHFIDPRVKLVISLFNCFFFRMYFLLLLNA